MPGKSDSFPRIEMRGVTDYLQDVWLHPDCQVNNYAKHASIFGKTGTFIAVYTLQIIII